MLLSEIEDVFCVAVQYFITLYGPVFILNRHMLSHVHIRSVNKRARSMFSEVKWDEKKTMKKQRIYECARGKYDRFYIIRRNVIEQHST